MKSIVLCSTLHDPDSSLVAPLKKALPSIKKNYKKWVVSVTETTGKEIIEELKEADIEVVVQKNELSPDSVEDNHLAALNAGLDFIESEDKLQYTDGDRIIFAGAYFAEEVNRVVDEIMGNESGCISLTRSFEDNQDHHDPLVLTEQSFTRVYQMALGEKVDPGSTAHVFSKKLCQYILDSSSNHEVMSFPHGKWEVLAKEGGFSIDAIETHGMLGFETPLQSREMMVAESFIDGSGSDESATELRKSYQSNRLPSKESLRDYYRWNVEYQNQMNPGEWGHRFKLAKEWIEYIEKEIPELNLKSKTVIELKKLIHKEKETLEEMQENVFSEKKDVGSTEKRPPIDFKIK